VKEIKGHKSRGAGEIVEILARTGSFTCPTLPHYRYSGTQGACRTLKRLGLTCKSGRSPESVNIIPTPLFLEWKAERMAGKTALGAVRWVKERRRVDYGSGVTP
jgi:hypothetical protein